VRFASLICPIFLLSVSMAAAHDSERSPSAVVSPAQPQMGRPVPPGETPCVRILLICPAPLLVSQIESPKNDGAQPPTGQQSAAGQQASTDQSSSGQIPAIGETAGVAGTVLDATGGAVSGAEVNLKEISEAGAYSAVTGPDGKFMFHDLAAGTYVITVKAGGFQVYTSANLSIAANQELQVPNIVLSVAPASTAVVVRPTEEIAAEEIKAEEKQRIIGFIPSFYTSYVWNAAPLNARQKFSLALRDTFDPVDFLGVSFTAGMQQARNVFPGYGQGAQGYGKRWGAALGDTITYDILGRAAFPALFHQDPRYFYQGSGSTWSRTRHAISYAFVARSDGGRVIPNYSTFLGAVGSGAISTLYYPSSDRGAGLVFTNAGIAVAERVGENLLREFVFKHFTKHVPANGKPATEDDTH
jgi:hypothetical protein